MSFGEGVGDAIEGVLRTMRDREAKTSAPVVDSVAEAAALREVEREARHVVRLQANYGPLCSVSGLIAALAKLDRARGVEPAEVDA